MKTYLLSENIMKIEKKIEERILFLKKKHEKEEEENYNTITIKKRNNQEIAEEINKKNIIKEKEMNKLKDLLIKTSDEKEIKRKLLSFELKNLKPKKKNMKLMEYKKEAKKILEKYQWKAGGYNLDDIEWNIHTIESTEYDVKDNEILLENTIISNNLNENEERYLHLITKRLNNISTNIRAKLRYKKTKDSIYYILIWCTDIKKQKVKIGL